MLFSIIKEIEESWDPNPGLDFNRIRCWVHHKWDNYWSKSYDEINSLILILYRKWIYTIHFFQQTIFPKAREG